MEKNMYTLNRFAVHKKLTQHCKHLNKKNLFVKKRTNIAMDIPQKLMISEPIR